MNIYYTYIYLDPRITGIWETTFGVFNYEPFYVGKGKGQRYLVHLKGWAYKYKNPHLYNRISNIKSDGFEPIVMILKNNILQEDALAIEAKLINELGTRKNISQIKLGPLVNLKLDGKVQRFSDETKQKISESARTRKRKSHSDETKQKMRLASANFTEEQRKQKSERISKKIKGKKLSEQQCERLSLLHKGKKLSDEQKEKLRITSTGRKHSPESLLKMSLWQIKKWKIENINTGIFITDNLADWCKSNNINYHTLYNTLKSQKFHKLHRLVEKVAD
jgi:hypothetical protein